jgi:hypothetical protein
MSEIISCPSCQRKVQVPEALAGQDVQCPTCGATFVANLPGAAPPARAQSEPERWDVTSERPASWSDRPPAYERPAYDDRDDYRRPPPDDYGGYGRPQRRDLAPHRGGLILALGLIGILVCNFLSPVAWIMGNTDLAEMRAGRMDPDGEGMTQAGRILGIIGTVLFVLAFCGFALFFMMALSAGGRGGRF